MSIFTKYQLERKKCYDKQWVTFAQCLWMVQVSSFSTWQGNIITVPGAQCLHIFRGFQQDISMLFLGMGQNEWPPRMASWMLKIANSLGRSSLEPDFWQATLVQDLRRFSEFHEMGGANMGESRGSEDPCSAIAFTTFYNNMWRPIMYPIVWGAWNGTQKAQNVKGWWESEDTSEAVALATKMWFSQVSGWWDGHGSEYGFSKCVDFFWYFKSSTVFETMIPNDANDWCLSVGLKPPVARAEAATNLSATHPGLWCIQRNPRNKNCFVFFLWIDSIAHCVHEKLIQTKHPSWGSTVCGDTFGRRQGGSRV